MIAIVLAAALPFYTDLLARGQADAVAHRDAKAAEELRVAAFGLLDDVPLYESAQMYLAVVNARLGRKDEARFAATRVANAERLHPGAGASIDPAIRTEFEESGLAARSRRDSVPAAVRAGGPLSEAALGTIAARQQKWGEAVDHFATARTRIHLTPEEMIEYGEALRHLGRTKEAKSVYIQLAAVPTLRRDVLLQVAQGLNQTFAWQESSAAYRRAFPLLKGEEMHMFHEAVNRYEMGDLQMARELLQRALPSLPETREVILYRGRILGKR